ncbi:MAG: hypothetical protein KC912_26240 [Proteobacteria bacterium]|nr:hypothetical protein [Pseudomonadota bacterium]
MKVVAVCWEDQRRSREERGTLLRGPVADTLLASGVTRLTLAIADEHARVRSPSPFPLFGPKPVAVVNAWTEDAEPVIATLREAGFTVHAWRADESIYADYGDNPHAGPRDWPDGTRSPGITVVSLLERPGSLDRAAWIERWHGVISPISEAIQPRTRYVRNVLEEALTEDAPPFEGLVEECWPSPETLTDPYQFYGANGVVELVGNMTRIVRAVHHCFWIWRIHSAVMSEWLLRTEAPR